jgi:hypothetical protein
MRDFPEQAFALKTVELRSHDRNFLYPDEFADEQPVLREVRLLVPRPIRDKNGNQIEGLLFRHDKVMDFLMYPAFALDETLVLDKMDDPRFRGVYLLIAQVGHVERAECLRDLLVTRATESLDHSLSDEFVRRFNARMRSDKR